MADRDGAVSPAPSAGVAATAPATAADRAPPGVSGLSQFVLVHKQGRVWIKFSCPCGQRLLFPTQHPSPVGRCGRCGREHRLVGMEKRIAVFEKHLQAAQAAHAGGATDAEDESLVTRLLKSSDYAAAAGPEFQTPEADSFQAFFHRLTADTPPADASRAADATGGIPPQRSGAGPAADSESASLAAADTVELPAPPPRPRADPARTSAVGESRGDSRPGETASLTDFDLAPFEPRNSARIRETADLAADRLRPRSAAGSAVQQPGGLIWAWPPASRFQRLLAAGVDLIAPALGAAAAAFLARLAGAGASDRLLWAWTVSVALGLIVDGIGLLLWQGASPGKRLTGIHVRGQNGILPGIVRGLARSLLKWALTPIGWLSALADTQARGLHDWLCATRVLYGRPR